ncbi:MAG: response regulator transcription factor [Steroidobacteraceae bacterium]
MTQHRIAVIEDDSILREDLVDYLDLQGHAVVGFATAEDFHASGHQHEFALAVLDIVLPGESGLKVAEWLRMHSPRTGIIILTSLGSSADQVRGLKAGADTYLAKNAPLDVIAANCESMLRRLPPATPTGEAGQLDRAASLLKTPSGAMIHLTWSEMALLEALIEAHGQPVARASILNRQGRKDTLNNERNLDGATARLRRKVMESAGEELPVRPCYGIGYQFTAEAVCTGRASTGHGG